MVKLVIDDDLNLVIKGGVDPDDLLLVINDTVKRYCDLKIIPVDTKTLTIDGDTYKLSDIVLKTINEVATEYVNANSLYLKSIEDCLPEADGFPPMVSACIKAMKASKPRVLTQTQHNRKLSHIRELEKLKDGQRNNISMARLEELLFCYGLDITDIIKEKYLK